MELNTLDYQKIYVGDNRIYCIEKTELPKCALHIQKLRMSHE